MILTMLDYMALMVIDSFLSHDERPAPAAGGLTGDNVDAGEVSC